MLLQCKRGGMLLTRATGEERQQVELSSVRAEPKEPAPRTPVFKDLLTDEKQDLALPSPKLPSPFLLPLPSECVFSTTGDVVRAQRSEMLPRNVEILTVLKNIK